MPSSTAPPVRRPSVQLREARRHLLDAGELPTGLLDARLQASWQRSLGFGLAADGRTHGAPHASAAQLTRALEHRGQVVSHARPVMAFLNEQIRDTGCMVILADPHGMLLHALGDAGFTDKAARVALRPGANWHEQWRGTNAIGTALAEGSEVVVHGAEHYLGRNAFLTCAAAPIRDSAGQVLGVLDISGHHRSHHPHTLGLVRSGARMIENRLFEARHGAGLQLRLHREPEGLGTLSEGLLALSEDGWIVGANAAALALLGLPVSAVGSLTLERVLATGLEPLLAGNGRSANGPRPPRALRREDGSVLWVRVETGRSVVCSSSGAAPRAAPTGPGPNDALAALDTGDGAMQAVIGRARRVIDKPIALLLQGESGVGKELFARACHRSGPRRDGPFVAVNCAALPETMIEAELFGYRPGAFTGASRDGAPGRFREAHGGLLFLDEIGDMPLAMQARLLRVLQERQVTPLGGGKPQPVDFQLVCATHHRLPQAVDDGRFREDLYYRLNGLTLTLPPLRERSDLDALVAKLLSDLAPAGGLELAADVAAAFGRYRWPGNLRQLANVLRTACALADDDTSVIDWSHLPDDIAEELIGAPAQRPEQAPTMDAADASDLRGQTDRCIRQAVSDSHGNLSDAARRLGISRNTLYRRLRALDATPAP